MWYKYCIYMFVDGKMIPAETIQGMGKKGELWKGWLQV
jgi:hypothetical protein